MNQDHPKSRPDPDAEPPHEDLARMHFWRIQSVRDILVIVLALTVVWLGYRMSAITVPLLVALGLAYLFEPVISVLQRKLKWQRTAAVSLILGLFMTGVILVAVPVGVVVVGQTASFVRNAATGRYADGLDKAIAMLPENARADVQRGKDWIEEALPWSARVFGDDMPTEEPASAAEPVTANPPADPQSAPTAEPESQTAGDPASAEDPIPAPQERALQAMVEAEVSRQLAAQGDPLGFLGTGSSDTASTGEPRKPWAFGTSAFDLVGAGARRLWGIALGVIELGLVVFLVPFYFFFFATAYPRVLEFARGLVPREHEETVFHLVGEMDRAVSGFVRGRLVISSILGAIFAIGWLIVGVPYSLALGLLVGVFCAVPYLSVIGVPIAIGLLVVDQVSLPEADRYAWWGLLLWPTLVYMIGQSMDDWVLTPFIQGKATDLNPVAIVVAVLAGGTLAGLYGMLLAVPVAACVKIALRELLMPRIRAWADGRARDPLPGG